MKKRLASSVLATVVLALSCTQVYAKTDCTKHPTNKKCAGNTVSVPEPSTIALLGLSLLGIGLARKKSNNPE